MASGLLACQQFQYYLSSLRLDGESCQALTFV